MNIYKPFNVIDDNSRVLHLSESKARRRFLFIFFRIYPFVLLFLVGVAIAATGGDLPTPFAYFLFGAVLFVCILLLTRKVIYEVLITPEKIVVKYGTITGIMDSEYLLTDAKHLHYRHSGGRGGGLFFDFVTKDGKKHRFLTIPNIYMNLNNGLLICDRLTEITGLEVKNRY